MTKLNLPHSKRLLALLIMGAGAAGLLVYQYHHEQAVWVTEEQGRALTTIGDIKADAIASWRRERLGEARGVSSDIPLSRFVRDYLGSGGRFAEREILNYFELLKTNRDYTGIFLFDASGKLRLSSEHSALAADDEAAALAVRAVTSRTPIFEDFHSGHSNSIHLAVAGPVYGDEGRAVAALVFKIDPQRFLYPQLQRWPTASNSGETLLVRREGDTVLYLNDLRHRKDAALKLRFPADDQHLPAAIAVNGYQGVVRGTDYRGVPVLASVRRVPNSPWFLVAKIDVAEAYATLNSRTRYFAVTVVLLFVLIGFALFLTWSLRESYHYRQLYALESERRALASRYEYLQRYANDVIVLVDENGSIVEGNERAISTYGYSREQFLSLNIRNLRDPSTLQDLDRQWAAATTDGGTVFETRHRRADGSVFPVEVSSRAVQIGGQMFRQSFVRDISERKRAEEALRNSQADLNRAQAVAHTGSWRLNVRANELLWSDETHRIFGIERATRLTYEMFLSAVHPDDRELVDRSWQAAMRGEGYDVEHRIVVNGEVKWVRERAELDFDQQGLLQDGFGTVQDITERKRADQALLDSEQRFRQLVENIDSVFWIVDPCTNRFLYLSPAFERVWGLSIGCLGEDARNWAALIHPEDRLIRNIEEHQFTSNGDRYGDVSEFEYRIVLPPGEVHWVRERTFAISDENGRVVRVAGISEDITERKRTEQALQRMNESLQEFAFAASHDLQEPIRVVQCFTQLLARRHKEQLDANGQRLLETIIDATRRMAELVQGLLAYTRLTQQERLSSPVDMQEALASALALLRAALEECSAVVTHDALPTVAWDSAPAVQLLQNLIGNALKYRHPERTLQVHVGCQCADGMWQFSVRDNGIGMDPALVDRVFGLFKRLHGREYPGTGIGLAICRKLVERQGGSIWAESELGKGSVFHFSLPMQVSAEPVTASAELMDAI